MRSISDRVIERFCQYRRALTRSASAGAHSIFSHELAHLVHLSADTVRQDIRILKYQGTPTSGYQIEELILRLNNFLQYGTKENVAIVGLGNLGKALLSYYKTKQSFFSVVAAFDIEPSLIGRMIHGIPCYHSDDIPKMARELGIQTAVLALPEDTAQGTADSLVKGGVLGIVNFTSRLIQVPAQVYVEYVDMTTILEKTIYFARHP